MKVVIIGDGKVGNKIAEKLADENHDIIVVDKSADALKRSTDALDIISISGDGASKEVLMEANMADADLAIASASTDEFNLLCCLMARKLGAKHTIARVRNPIYYQQMEFIKEDLKLSMVVNPDFVAADEISRIVIFPTATKIETFVKGRVELAEFKIDSGSVLEGLTLLEIYKKYQIKVLVCAVQRNQEVVIPSGDFKLEAGDKIHVTAPHAEIEKFFRLIGILKNKARTAMIAGGGRISYYLAKSLSNMGIAVKIIERNPQRCHELCELLPDAEVINADAADHELLEEEGIGRVDAFVSLTGVDEENIIMSMYANSQKVPTVITKINNESLTMLTEHLGLSSVISPKSETANRIVSYVRAMENTQDTNIETLYRLVEDKIEALEFVIRKQTDYLNIPLKNLNFKRNVLVACIARGNRIIIPGGDDYFQVGDSVVVVTTLHSIQNLKEIFS